MRKLLPLALCLVMLLTACARAEELTGTANGYGGELTVAVRKNGNDIVGIEVTSHNETESVAGPALEKIPQEILAKNGTEGVDVVTGATITSKAIIQAVNNALGATAEAPGATTPSPANTSAATHIGFGINTMGRVGPGADNEDVPVYSLNEVFVSALFDTEGRIVDIYVDQLEVATPNYDSTTMPKFSGFPGQGGYNWDQNGDGTVDGKTDDTEENFLNEIANWKTKRQRGSTYVMAAGTWAEQMDAFQQRVFIGKTVDEIEAWFRDYCSNVNGRPLKDGSDDADDKAKYDALTDADKSMLADVTSSATMSLNDSHGNIIAAIRNAYDSRVALRAGTENDNNNNATPAPLGLVNPTEAVTPDATEATTESNG